MATYERIIVGTDFSTHGKGAIDAAAALARKEPRSKLTLVHVLDVAQMWGGALPYDLSGPQIDVQLRAAEETARNRLQALVELIADIEVDVLVRKGYAAEELARVAHSTQADLIVVATQGLGAIQRAILGSVTTTLLDYAPCPVLVVGEDRADAASARKILAAIDLSPGSYAVLEQAFDLARAHRGGVKVVSVFEEPVLTPGLQRQTIRQVEDLNIEVERLASAISDGIPFEVTVLQGSPPHVEILEFSKRIEAELIVVGRSGHRTWSKAIFGTNGARICRNGNAPVMVVPPVAGPGKEAAAEQLVYATVEPEQLPKVVNCLVDASIPSDDISVVMSRATHLEAVREGDFSDQGFVAGGAVGGSAGGILGGLASLAVPSGVALAVVGPAVALGLVGGLVGSLMGRGVAAHDASRLQDLVEAGKVLVAVHTYNAQGLIEAKRAFADAELNPRRMRV